MPIPAWPTFAEAARIAGGTPVFVPLHVEQGFRLTARAVARSVGPQTRAVVVNSPSNPTGAVIEPGELLKLARARQAARLLAALRRHLRAAWCSTATASRRRSRR